MAAAMMCPAHGPVDGPTCIPGCMEPLQPHIDPPAAPAATCPALGCDMPQPCPLHSGRRTPDAGHRELAAYLAASRPIQQQQRRPAGGAALRFPWGTVTVPACGLSVGRDFGADCGAQIDAYDNVSREHARIVVDNGELFVEDLHSTNGTTVNGVPTVPGRRHPLSGNDIIGFGNRLRVTVNLPGTPE